MGHTEHVELTPEISLGSAVLTISDSRTEAEDESGKLAKDLLVEAGHPVRHYGILPNDQARITEEVQALINREDVRVIITSGGTGVGRKDKTVGAVKGLLDKEIIGFGELFRHLSYLEIGPAGMVSGAFGGVSGDKIIFCLPGSKGAMRLALTKLILPQLAHIAWELDRA